MIRKTGRFVAGRRAAMFGFGSRWQCLELQRNGDLVKITPQTKS